MSAIGFQLPHSSLIRIWHWLLFAVLTFSLFTVLIGNTLLKTRANINLVKENLAHSGLVVTNDQARGVAHEFHDLIWTWHKIIGYGLGSLLIARFLIEFVQTKEERIAARIKSAQSGIAYPGADVSDLRHFILVNRVYLLFFLLLGFMALTGLGMAYEDDVPWLDHIKNINHTLHGYGQYLMYTYLIVHITGVVVSDMTKHKGMVSSMINGKP